MFGSDNHNRVVFPPVLEWLICNQWKCPHLTTQKIFEFKVLSTKHFKDLLRTLLYEISRHQKQPLDSWNDMTKFGNLIQLILIRRKPIRFQDSFFGNF